jgi:hypothetical protein
MTAAYTDEGKMARCIKCTKSYQSGISVLNVAEKIFRLTQRGGGGTDLMIFLGTTALTKTRRLIPFSTLDNLWW